MVKLRTAQAWAIGGVIVGVVLGIMSYHFLVARAGNLEPTDPPGPTMKTLDEVEPRIPIPASATPAAAFVINSPGSYYLTGDRNASGNGIEVNADNVTIYLMGYGLIGPASGTNYGIYMNERTNVEVRNGTIRNFGRYGVYGVQTYERHHWVIGVRAVSNGVGGIYLKGDGHLVKGCRASYNGPVAAENVYGIYTDGGGNTVTDNTVAQNGNRATGTYVYGIYAGGEGNTVTGNMVYKNGYSAGSNVFGIKAGSGSTVTGNTARDNQGYGISADTGSTVTGNTVYKNQSFGIATFSGCTVTGNTAYYNQGYGIYIGGCCTVTGNTAYSNGGTGIRAATGSTVTGNTAYLNQFYGIYLAGGNSLVDQNTAYNNNQSGGAYVNMNNPGNCTFGVNHAP